MQYTSTIREYKKKFFYNDAFLCPFKNICTFSKHSSKIVSICLSCKENSKFRDLMRRRILPQLNQMGVTTVLGELDFGGGPLVPSITAAVTSTRKTVVFLSKDIFQVWCLPSYRMALPILAFIAWKKKKCSRVFS